MAIKRGEVELRILEDHILIKTTSPGERPSTIGVAPREGRNIWDALHSIIRSIDSLPPPYIIEAIEIVLDRSMKSEALKSLKKIRPKLKSPNVKKLITALIDRLEKFSNGPSFDPSMN